MKKIISFAIAVLILVSCFSCADKKIYEEEAKSFSAGGITITLTEAFTPVVKEGYAAVYDSEEVAVFALREPFESFENKELTAEKYAEFVREANKDNSPGEVTRQNGLLYVEYSAKNAESGKTYKYFTVVFEGTDAYWCVQFVCEESDYSEYMYYFINWAKTVTFAPKS